jgi:hypothetical protein
MSWAVVLHISLLAAGFVVARIIDLRRERGSVSWRYFWSMLVSTVAAPPVLLAIRRFTSEVLPIHPIWQPPYQMALLAAAWLILVAIVYALVGLAHRRPPAEAKGSLFLTLSVAALVLAGYLLSSDLTFHSRLTPRTAGQMVEPMPECTVYYLEPQDHLTPRPGRVLRMTIPELRVEAVAAYDNIDHGSTLRAVPVASTDGYSVVFSRMRSAARRHEVEGVAWAEAGIFEERHPFSSSLFDTASLGDASSTTIQAGGRHGMVRGERNGEPFEFSFRAPPFFAATFGGDGRPLWAANQLTLIEGRWALFTLGERWITIIDLEDRTVVVLAEGRSPVVVRDR